MHTVYVPKHCPSRKCWKPQPLGGKHAGSVTLYAHKTVMQEGRVHIVTQPSALASTLGFKTQYQVESANNMQALVAIIEMHACQCEGVPARATMKPATQMNMSNSSQLDSGSAVSSADFLPSSACMCQHVPQ